MIDFDNKGILKLRGESLKAGENAVKDLLIPGEIIVGSYVSVRDRVVFTNKRIISCNVQGLSGKKIDYTSIPYSKIQTFSVETSGMLDLDAELEVWLSGIGKVKFELAGGVDIKALCQTISAFILN